MIRKQGSDSRPLLTLRILFERMRPNQFQLHCNRKLVLKRPLCPLSRALGNFLTPIGLRSSLALTRSKSSVCSSLRAKANVRRLELKAATSYAEHPEMRCNSVKMRFLNSFQSRLHLRTLFDVIMS
jgi:hypothetical protein